MMNTKILVNSFLIAMFLTLSCGVFLAVAQDAQQTVKQDMKPSATLPEGKYARLDTSLGKVLILLLEKQAPKTVENFIALATGQKEYTDPGSGRKTKRRLYDGTIFYRVRDKQFIQGGCLLGTGNSQLGFTIPDEIDPAGKQVAGSLSMFRNMNAKDSANSQFILSCTPLDWLNGRLTIFGQTVYGLRVVENISKQKVGLKDKPLRKILLNKVTIIEVTAEEPLTVTQALNKGDRVILVEGDTLSDAERLRRMELNRQADADSNLYYQQGRFGNNVLWARDIIGTPKETLLDAKTWLELRKRMAEERDAQQKKLEEEKKKKEKVEKK